MDTVLTAVMPRRRRGQHHASRKNYASCVGTELLATIIMHLLVKGVKVWLYVVRMIICKVVEGTR